MNTATPGAPGSEFDDFLYASIAEEHNGTVLSVLSALARSNLDPWAEAARLAGLPRAAARQSLTTLIAAIPEDRLPRMDSEALVERLIGLLPKRVSPANRPPAIETHRTVAPSFARNAAWALYIAAILFMLVTQWRSGHSEPHEAPAGGATTAAPAAKSP
jgi:hypothetical protein